MVFARSDVAVESANGDTDSLDSVHGDGHQPASDTSNTPAQKCKEVKSGLAWANADGAEGKTTMNGMSEAVANGVHSEAVVDEGPEGSATSDIGEHHSNGLSTISDAHKPPSTSAYNDSELSSHTDGHHSEENGTMASVASSVEKRPHSDTAATSAEVECIEIDDDDTSTKGPPAKKKRDNRASPIPDDPQTKSSEKNSDLSSCDALLDKLEEYVSDAINTNNVVGRKVLDALLGAINIQVQRNPLSIRKLILDKQLVLPNTISHPPSLVVDMLIEHDPEAPLSKVLTRMFGGERPKLTENEKRERQQLKLTVPAPNMTKLLMDIGQDLVQESTYSDIVHAKNLPETPKNMETYKQVAQQLKPVWEALRKKNEPFRLRYLTCPLCAFTTESRIVLAAHKQVPHFDGRKFQCAMCPEYFTNENMISQHYLKMHEVVAGKQESLPRNPCACCDSEFIYKGERDKHMKKCRKDLNYVRLIMAPRPMEDVSAVNQWLWEKPAVDPSILQQQQAAQKEQLERQQRAQLVRQQQLDAQKQKQLAAEKALLAAQQQAAFMLQQQKIRAAQAASTASAATSSLLQRQQGPRRTPSAPVIPNLGNPALLAAIQQQLQRASALAGVRQPGLPAFPARTSAPVNRASLPSSALNSSSVRQKSPQVRLPTGNAAATVSHSGMNACEICDQNVHDKERYLMHLQLLHKQLRGKTPSDMMQGAPLACSRCRERFWTYEGLERHLLMAHGLVTSDLLAKAQSKKDGGRCKLCGKQYAFNMLQHLVMDHHLKLCSAEIQYSCDVCAFKCSSYTELEAHLNTVHPKNPLQGLPANSQSATPSPVPGSGGGSQRSDHS